MIIVNVQEIRRDPTRDTAPSRAILLRSRKVSGEHWPQLVTSSCRFFQIGEA